METSSQNRLDPSLISYITLRRAVGILGIALPVVLVTGSCIFGHCSGGSKFHKCILLYNYEKYFCRDYLRHCTFPVRIQGI